MDDRGELRKVLNPQQRTAKRINRDLALTHSRPQSAVNYVIFGLAPCLIRWPRVPHRHASGLGGNGAKRILERCRVAAVKDPGVGIFNVENSQQVAVLAFTGASFSECRGLLSPDAAESESFRHAGRVSPASPTLMERGAVLASEHRRAGSATL